MARGTSPSPITTTGTTTDTNYQYYSREFLQREGCPFLPWDLERIQEDRFEIDGQLSNTCDNTPATGSGVHVYIIDTGIAPHNEFGSRLGQALDCTRGGECQLDAAPTDDLGHGTAVGSISAGSCLGVATGATVHPIRVVDSSGSGSLQAIINGIRWATETSEANGWRGVINISLTSPRTDALDQAVAKAVDKGMVVVTAAGNQGFDACDYSPGSSPASLAVGATKIGYDGDVPVDEISLLSNTGQCVGVYAPGQDIPSASHVPSIFDVTSKPEYDQIVTLSGTSQAAPLAAGAAALYLETHANATPEQVKQAIQNASVPFIQDYAQQEGSYCCNILNIKNLVCE